MGPGDSRTIENLVSNGYVSSNKQYAYLPVSTLFTINKSVSGVTCVGQMRMNARQNNGYVIGSSTEPETIDSGIMTVFYLGSIVIRIDLSGRDVTNVTNNDTLSFEVRGLTLQFT